MYLGAHTIRSHGVTVARFHMHDWLILLLLIVIEIVLNVIEPFHRFVGEDMLTDLTYPLQDNTVPFWAVPLIAVVLPFAVISVYYFIRRDVYDLHHAILGLLFSVLITGVITDAIKDAVGRPRPDFFWRCFPDGRGVSSFIFFLTLITTLWIISNQLIEAVISSFTMSRGMFCVLEIRAWSKRDTRASPAGTLLILRLGYVKPAGSFAGLGFLALYLSGKVRVFDRRGHVAKLCIVILPLLVAALVGVSRVDDYWHHWQDVFGGAIIGLTVSSFCYLQFFPPPYDPDGWGPHAYFQMLADSRNDVQNSAGMNHLSVRQAELENVYVDQQETSMEISRSNTRDTTRMLESR
ncbi:unnamed protein product [Thlaspi arvense]|uniref:Phosphatidic acid phosphatase type 2/haloperoxidase domain-containing protein n=1 Tax=Thlaspi arvense TaxID=13288 RepID=A0AAU9RB00_THLAR|nr:unnamed protein product [Thlaspi arvense]